MSRQVQAEREVFIYLPAPLLPIRLSKAGISYRLSAALRKLGKVFIGELDGLSARDLLNVDPRGLELMTELVEIIQNLAARIQSLQCCSSDPPRRYYYYRKKQTSPSAPLLPSCPSVENSAFRVPNSALDIVFRIQPVEFPPTPSVNIPGMLTMLEQRLACLMPRDLLIIHLRFAGTPPPSSTRRFIHSSGESSIHSSTHPRSNAPATIFEIAKAADLSTEGVRRILEDKVRLLREFSGPEFSAALAALSAHCQQHNCILTPSLLSDWLHLNSNPNLNPNRSADGSSALDCGSPLPLCSSPIQNPKSKIPRCVLTKIHPSNHPIIRSPPCVSILSSTSTCSPN